jgi:4-amino-4-deoxy-L-arabinose transferase-like glycosyltransferase
MFARATRFLNPQPESKLPRRLFWTAFLVRVLYLTLAHTYRIRLANDHFQYGWEMGRIARALVHGFGYSDPFSNHFFPHTGPTAWVPPLYPLIIAAIFKIFGVYTRTSAWVLLTINSAFSAATAVAIYEIAVRCYNRRVALWSAWIWALYPAAMQYAVRWVWEMALTTALFTWVLALSLRMRNIGNCEPSSDSSQPATRNLQPATAWALFGLLWGLIALSNSTLLIFLPINGLWILLGTHRRQHIYRDVTLAALVFLASIAPWTIRNQRVFHTFIPLRGNFGAELYLGNGPGSNGLLMEYDHPFQSLEQLRLYASMGEVRYVAMRATAAKAYIAADPGHFLADTARRIYFFWISVPHPSDDAWYIEAGRVLDFAFISIAGLLGLTLALRRRVPAAGLFAWVFLLLPIPYYLVTVHARFRHPLEPLICIFGVYLFQSATPRPAVKAGVPHP